MGLFGKKKIDQLVDKANSIDQKREQLNQLDQSYSAIVKRQFLKNKPAVWSLRVLFLIAALALMADFIANEKPLYCKYKGKSYFPVLKSYAIGLGLSKWPADLTQVEWKTLEYDKVMWPPVPYSPNTIDLANGQFTGPSDKQFKLPSPHFKHRLGTDELGRDTLSGMIHGTRIAMLVGIISMAIASLIGILLGSLAGYFGDSKLKMPQGIIIFSLIGLPLAIFYAFIAVKAGFLTGMLIFSVIMVFTVLLGHLLGKIPFLGKRVAIPLDILVMRLIEIMRSVPTLILILSVIAIVKPSILIVMVVIGGTGWTGIARFIRGELLRVRSLEYIEAAEALGYNRARIILRHAIPNSLTPVLIAIAFGIASAILVESTLSFLGIGVPAETITWGKLLSFGRADIKAWWLVIFPGFAIFVTVTIFNLLGDGLADAIDPKLKQ